MNTIADRYELKEEIGRGGMATVYRGYDLRFMREVAIKVLPMELLQDPTFTGRFRQEAYAVASLEHSAIIPIYDYGEQNTGQPYLVMRYMKGGTLKNRLQSAGAYTVEEALSILERIASALDAAHQARMIHRDVKPHNILFDEYGEAYLGDFGLVKMLEGAQNVGHERDVIGTPAYMAPEVTSDGVLTPAIDTYALTVTLFQMLTGQLPFGSKEPVGQLIANATQAPPNMTHFRAELPSAVDFVIRRGLAKQPRHRYERAGLLASDFQAALRQQPLSFDPELEPGTIDLAQSADRVRRWITHNKRITFSIAGAIGLLLVSYLLILSVGPRATAQPVVLPALSNASPIPAVAAPAIGRIGGGGEYIVYQSNRGSNNSLFLVSSATREQVPVTPGDAGNELQAAWSPDGTKLAYVSDQDGDFDIYVLDIKSGKQYRLTDDPASDLSPSWSPDGSQLAFASDRDGTDFDIYVMTLNNLRPVGEPVRLTDNQYNDLDPRWSPQDNLLVYTVYINGTADIGLITVSSTVRGLLTEDISDDISPEWSPDGTQIAFASPRDGDWEIYTIYTDGSGLRQFTVNTLYDGEPAWSPDGKWIVYSSGRYLTQHLFVATTDGSKHQELTAQTSYFFDSPAWQPASPHN